MTSLPDSNLQQFKLFYGKNHFEIKPGKYISVEHSETAKSVKFDIDLVALSPDSRIQIQIAWHWLLAIVMVLIATTLVITLSQFISDKILLEYKNYLVLILVILFALFISLFVIFSKRKRIFTTRHAKLPVIEILISNPTKDSYLAFVEGLENEIIITAESRGLNSKQQRAGELKTLRRLSQLGVISKNEYEESKQILLFA